jgi:hypothetical protein
MTDANREYQEAMEVAIACAELIAEKYPEHNRDVPNALAVLRRTKVLTVEECADSIIEAKNKGHIAGLTEALSLANQVGLISDVAALGTVSYITDAITARINELKGDGR